MPRGEVEPWQSSRLSLTEEPHPGQGRRVVLAGDAAPVMGSMDVAARLTAAKPVSWRGRSDLPQYPWAKPFQGTWLVVDLGWCGGSLRSPPRHGCSFLRPQR